MKEVTIKRLNTTVISYLSIAGLANGKYIDQENPISIYFMSNILSNMTQPVFSEQMLKKGNIEIDMEDVINQFKINVPLELFHQMIQEFYNIYKKIDNIKKEQDSEVRNMMVEFVGSQVAYNTYIDEITERFKSSFYELVRFYNSDVAEYNNVKMELLSDRLKYCVDIEDYEEAAVLRDRIIKLKEEGK